MSGKRNWGDNMTHRQDGKLPPSPFGGYTPFKVASKLWKKKYECKKNKGDHTWAVHVLKWGEWKQKDGYWIEPHDYFSDTKHQLPYWVSWRCAGCNKHDYEWRTLNKKFDPHRPHHA